MGKLNNGKAHFYLSPSLCDFFIGSVINNFQIKNKRVVAEFPEGLVVRSLTATLQVTKDDATVQLTGVGCVKITGHSLICTLCHNISNYLYR